MVVIAVVVTVEAVIDMNASGIELEVCEDIARRQANGVLAYGMPVADNPLSLKAWMTHAYHEALDQAIYLKRAIREIEVNERFYAKH